MPYTRPTLEELINRTEDALRARLGGTAARRAVNKVIARVFAGGAHEEYGAIDFYSKQIIPNTAEGEFLELWANAFGLSRLPATFAVGNVDFAGNAGAIIDAGVILSDSEGIQYTSDSSTVLPANVPVTASLAGDGGNLETGITLALQVPIIGVTNPGIIVAPGITGGFPEETDDQLRERLLTILRTAPRGGAEVDYIFWAQLIAGVGRVFVFGFNGGQPGRVDVSFLTDDIDDPIPDAAQIALVQESIVANRPVTTWGVTFPLILAPIDFTMSITPDTTEVRTNIENELKAFINRERQPGGTLFLSRISEAISQAAGEFDHVLAVPSADVVASIGTISDFGSITFT